MKKKILLFAIVLITIFAAVSCSYTFDARIGNTTPITYYSDSSTVTTVDHGTVYLFMNEEYANNAYAKLREDETLDEIEANIHYDRKADIVNGYFHMNINWVASSPSGGKDFDDITIWLIAVNSGDNVASRQISKVAETNCSSIGGIDSVDLTLYPIN